MITVRLLGGLGNQCFQYAYGQALKDAGYEVRYDCSHLIEGTHREYSLGYFSIEAGRYTTQQEEIYEGNFRYHTDAFNLPQSCTVIGYWQTEKYFWHIGKKIRKALSFPGVPVRYTQTIAVHVRRQDYVGLQHFHGMPEIEYYREAVAYIRREVGFDCQVVVFSDDPQWCKENFPASFLVMGEGNKYDHLKMIAACDYAVIANSSYSWWGAWLGPQKFVVAPKQWFTTPEIDYSDIVPERWVKL